MLLFKNWFPRFDNGFLQVETITDIRKNQILETDFLYSRNRFRLLRVFPQSGNHY